MPDKTPETHRRIKVKITNAHRPAAQDIAAGAS
jgi:hypothetical protein